MIIEHEGHAVGTQAEEHAVTEGNDPCIPKKDIETHGEDGENEDLREHDEHAPRIIDKRKQHQGHQACHPPVKRDAIRHAFHTAPPFSPMSPVGFTSKTKARSSMLRARERSGM